MIVSELIDLLREQEKMGRGDAVVLSDGFDIEAIGYDPDRDAVTVDVYELSPRDPLEDPDDDFEPDFEPIDDDMGDWD